MPVNGIRADCFHTFFKQFGIYISDLFMKNNLLVCTNVVVLYYIAKFNNVRSSPRYPQLHGVEWVHPPPLTVGRIPLNCQQGYTRFYPFCQACRFSVRDFVIQTKPQMRCHLDPMRLFVWCCSDSAHLQSRSVAPLTS